MIEPGALELLAFPHRRRADDSHHLVLHVHEVAEDPVRRVAAARGRRQRIGVRETVEVARDHAVDHAELLEQHIASGHPKYLLFIGDCSSATPALRSTIPGRGMSATTFAERHPIIGVRSVSSHRTSERSIPCLFIESMEPPGPGHAPGFWL